MAEVSLSDQDIESGEFGMENEGFVCYIGEDFVKIFDPVEQLINVPKIYFVDGVELGKFYASIDYEYTEADPKCTEPEVFVKDGVFHAKVLAFAPQLGQLDQDLRKKYKNTAWSSCLQILSDPNNLFLHFPYSEVAMTTVKYAPKGNTVFEVVAVDEPSAESVEEGFDGRQACAPWLIEGKVSLKEIYGKLSKKTPRFNQVKPLCKSRVFTGVCLLKRSELRLMKFDMREERQEIDYIYCSSLGLMKSIKKGIDLGQWISFKTHDRRTRSRKEYNKDQIHLNGSNVTAPDVLNPVLPTEIINVPSSDSCVEMAVTFLFDHDLLESTENRSKTDWKVRSMGFYKCVQFNDVILGPIYIYKEISSEIVKHIESHQKTLQQEDPALFEQLKNEKIAVEVKVRPIQNFFGVFLKAQLAPLFAAHSIGRISYLIGGRPIKKVPR